jgi:hypothetical protein
MAEYSNHRSEGLGRGGRMYVNESAESCTSGTRSGGVYLDSP